MFKALSEKNAFAPVTRDLDQSDFVNQRLDKHRMLLIILTRMLLSLQKLAKDGRDSIDKG
jgi:hypothetical protein